MIDPRDILKAAKAAVRADQGYKERHLIHPKREWLMGLLVFTAMLLVASVWAAWLYNSYKDVRVEVSTNTESVPTLQTAMMGDVLEYYRQREARFDQMYNSTPLQVSVPTTTIETAASTTTSTTTSSQDL